MSIGSVAKIVGIGVWSTAVFVGCGADGGDVGQEVSRMLPQATNAIGSACDTSAECGDSTGCRVDTDQHILDGQCTRLCKTNIDCSFRQANSKCLNAGVCVATCTTDLDCPARTQCNDQGWCQRTGPGSGKPSCAGTPTPCALLSGIACVDAGCRRIQSCTGLPTPCSSIQRLATCFGQQGCSAAATSGECTGTAATCSSFDFDLDCEAQQGCSWFDECGGAPSVTDCARRPPAVCNLTPGCQLEAP